MRASGCLTARYSKYTPPKYLWEIPAKPFFPFLLFLLQLFFLPSCQSLWKDSIVSYIFLLAVCSKVWLDMGRRQEKSLLLGAELKAATGDLVCSQDGNPVTSAQELPRWKTLCPSPWNQWLHSSPFGGKHLVQLSRASWRKLVGLCVQG